ncbi:hypothetical protein LTR49_027698 [Elasticomyces elasticus]|nr:hypothetical protein LTR49_027698 [Elasticomyces elasticus]
MDEQLPAYIVDVSYTIKPGDHEALRWMIVLYGDRRRTHSIPPLDQSKTIGAYLDLKPIEEDGARMYEGIYKGRCADSTSSGFNVHGIACGS